MFRAEIAEASGWCCGICRDPVDPSLKHPDPGYGSIDHIVPLASGGSNDPENLQLAHLVCNLRKRQFPEVLRVLKANRPRPPEAVGGDRRRGGRGQVRSGQCHVPPAFSEL